MAVNQVEIVVRSRNETRAGFAAATADAGIAGEAAGKAWRDRFRDAARGGAGGLLGPLLGSAAGRGAGGILGGLLGAGGAAGAAGAAGAGAGGAGIGGTIAAIGIPALLLGAGGIIPALAAAGLATLAFGALAIPTFQKVTAAITGTGKAGLAAWQALDPAQKQIVIGVQNIKKQWDAMSASLAPLVSQILGVAVKIAQTLLPALLPLAKAAGGAILILAQGFDKFAQSPGFKSFIDNFTRLAGPTILNIGQGIGKVTVALGKLLIALETPDAQRIIRDTFAVIAAIITGLVPVVEFVTKRIVLRIGEWSAFIGRTVHDIAAWWRDLELGLLSVGVFFLNWAKVIVNAAATAFGWIPGIGPRLRAAAAEFNNWVRNVNQALATLKNPPPLTLTVMTATGTPFKGTAPVGGTNRLTGAATTAVTGTGAGPAGPVAPAAAVNVVLSVAPGDDAGVTAALMKAIRAEVRNTGGAGPTSVQLALGRSRP